jgi:hypothetical protein
MHWPKQSDDPLAKVLREKYNLTAVSLPRSDISVGNLFVRPEGDGRLRYVGSFNDVLAKPLPLKVSKPATCSNIEGVSTASISLKVGINLLEGFFTALGITGIVSKIGAEFKKEHISKVKYSFQNIKREACPLLQVNNQLANNQLKSGSLDSSLQYFFCSGTIKSNAVGVQLLDKSDNAVGFSVGVLANMVTPSIKIGTDSDDASKVVFEGDDMLTFATELCRVRHYEGSAKLDLVAIDAGAVSMLGDDGAPTSVLDDGDNRFVVFE